jgi:hypothetical protein
MESGKKSRKSKNFLASLKKLASHPIRGGRCLQFYLQNEAQLLKIKELILKYALKFPQ